MFLSFGKIKQYKNIIKVFVALVFQHLTQMKVNLPNRNNIMLIKCKKITQRTFTSHSDLQVKKHKIMHNETEVKDFGETVP